MPKSLYIQFGVFGTFYFLFVTCQALHWRITTESFFNKLFLCNVNSLIKKPRNASPYMEMVLFVLLYDVSNESPCIYRHTNKCDNMHKNVQSMNLNSQNIFHSQDLSAYAHSVSNAYQLNYVALSLGNVLVFYPTKIHKIVFHSCNFNGKWSVVY